MPITVGAKRRWAVLIMLKRSASVNLFVVEPAERGRGVRGEEVAFGPRCPAQHWRDLLGSGQSSGLPSGGAIPFLAHRFAFQLDAVGIVHEVVEDAVSDGGIADLRVPGGDR